MTDPDTATGSNDPEGTDPAGEDAEAMDPGPALPFDLDTPPEPEPGPEPEQADMPAASKAEVAREEAAAVESPATTSDPGSAAQISPAYQVLARKYRPTNFEALIGQESMVRTLRNAIAQNRVAHAFVLTGVRGIGKTTTARIMARALNCIGEDGTGGPTVTPCGVCEHCVAIAGDRHMDVIEMDAASRTGVDDVREIIESVRYAPVSARFKIYIIDEVHMLSRNAFNALLKTLEEPPDHVKFIFATTEIRKLPVTVLSRCQRFDLRRLDVAQLHDHFERIAVQEGASVSSEALSVIAQAADGSVRDGLSLLDQAIAQAEADTVTADQVRQMLGWADRTQVFDLLEKTLGGALPEALDQLGELHAVGADPTVVLQDMLELVHWLTRCRVAPAALAGAAGAALPEAERVRGAELAKTLSMPALTRAWQMLLKGLQEAQQAPQPLPAAEMILIRLAYAAELPDPATVVRTLRAEAGGGGSGSQATGQLTGPTAASQGPMSSTAAGAGNGNGMAPRAEAARGAAAVSAVAAGSPAPSVAAGMAQPEADTAPLALAQPGDFDALVQLFQDQGELVIHAHLVNNVHLVQCVPGLLEFRPDDFAPPDLAGSVRVLLQQWTGRSWAVVLSSAPGDPTLAQQRAAEDDARRAAAERHPLVLAVRDVFPGATIDLVRAFEAEGPTPMMEEPDADDPGTDSGLQPGEFGADDDEDLDDWA